MWPPAAEHLLDHVPLEDRADILVVWSKRGGVGTHVRFDDIDFEADAEKVNSIVGSYAIEAGLEVDDDLTTEDFLHRLVTAGAFRWGVVFYLVMKSVGVAVSQQSGELTIEHFVQAWVDKTSMNPAATPFTHSGYKTMFRRDKPFQAAIHR